MALAYFITFTTYGTWLHGSSRGKGSVDSEHNEFGAPFIEPDAEREQAAREAMVQPPYVMGPAEREIVCKAIVELARERSWLLHAVHVRSNHVHVVISADRDPGRLMSDLKGRASRELTRAAFDTAERRRWTRHGSTLHLFRKEDVEARIRYTLDKQGERMACHDGRPKKEPRGGVAASTPPRQTGGAAPQKKIKMLGK
jgi:REP element-mobilizing transposase RayT